MIRLSSSSAPPRRWRYCCANSGPCEPISPASTATAKANLRANIGCPIRLPKGIAVSGAAVERPWRRGEFLPPIEWRYGDKAARGAARPWADLRTALTLVVRTVIGGHSHRRRHHIRPGLTRRLRGQGRPRHRGRARRTAHDLVAAGAEARARRAA